jgi:hypothetical protein
MKHTETKGWKRPVARQCGAVQVSKFRLGVLALSNSTAIFF